MRVPMPSPWRPRATIWTAAAVTTLAVLAVVAVLGTSVALADPSGSSAASTASPAAASTASPGAASTASPGAASTAGPGAAGRGASTRAGAARLAQACSGLPPRIERIERLQARLGAAATSAGSIAYLSARVGRATAAGNSALASVLTDRLAIRRDVASQLPDMLAKLQDAQQICQTHGAASAPVSS